MFKFIFNSVFFYSIFVAIISMPGVYDIFILGKMDKKFRSNTWEALEVYSAASAYFWFNLAITFFIFYFVTSKLRDLKISYKFTIICSVLTSSICLIYTINEPKAWDLSLRPDYVGVIVLILIFTVLNIFPKKIT